MSLNIDSFRTLASQTVFGSRDIAVQGQGETATARLGNFVFSQSAKTNDATMAAFKAALEKEYGVFGTHAFDTVLGARAQMHKSLRASDVTATLSKLETGQVQPLHRRTQPAARHEPEVPRTFGRHAQARALRDQRFAD